MKLLVVDDDRFSIQILDNKLKKWGHETISLNRASEAVEILKTDQEISLLITDWIMPEMDGLSLCKLARELKRDKYLSIILLTSRSEKEALIEGLNSGADAFLNKPLDFAELQAHLKVIQRIIYLENQLATQLDDLKKAHSNLQLALAKIEEIAHIDELTKIPNRRSIMEYLENEITRVKRYSSNLSVFILDIDHFKKVNDTYGHLVGDFVLKECAKILSENIRKIDRVGRYGGEEFLGVLPETSLNEALQVAERIRMQVQSKEIITEYNFSINITVSIGVVQFIKNTDTSISLLSRADSALYKAKEGGRNRVCINE